MFDSSLWCSCVGQVTIWRSADLSSGSWENIGEAVQCAHAPDCQILYRPHLVFNPQTKLYVLYFNYVSPHGYAGYAVLTRLAILGFLVGAFAPWWSF